MSGRSDLASVQRRIGSAENNAGLVTGTFLHHDRGGVDTLRLDLRERYAPGGLLAGQIAELEPLTHHVVVGDRAPAVHAAADDDGNRFGERAQPDLGGDLCLGRGGRFELEGAVAEL